eukprot:796392_1
MSSETGKCTATSFITDTVAITYGVIYSTLLIVVSRYSFRFLMQFDPKFQQSNAINKMRRWIRDIYYRRSCYIPIVAHIFDQITDVSVAVQFHDLATTKYHDDYAVCNGLNMWYLFILTVLSMIIYRVISCYLIYSQTKSITRLISQFLDLELFRALHINYIIESNTPCDPQRWITALEAALESTPQTLIQLIYLVKTNSYDPLVMISFLSSLWNIIAKLMSDDKVIVKEKAKAANIHVGKYCIYINPFYMIRFIWRVCDVTSRIVLMLLIWYIIGGTYLAAIILFESILFLALCICTSHWELLFGIVALVISQHSRTARVSSVCIDIYRTVTNIIEMVLVSIWLYGDFNCVRCTEVEVRLYAQDNLLIQIMFIYGWCAVIISPLFMSILLYLGQFGATSSASRDLKEMIKSENWNGILEMQLYKGNFHAYDETGALLIMLAIQQNRWSIITYLEPMQNKVNILHNPTKKKYLDPDAMIGDIYPDGVKFHVLRRVVDYDGFLQRNKSDENYAYYVALSSELIKLSSKIDAFATQLQQMKLVDMKDIIEEYKKVSIEVIADMVVFKDVVKLLSVMTSRASRFKSDLQSCVDIVMTKSNYRAINEAGHFNEIKVKLEEIDLRLRKIKAYKDVATYTELQSVVKTYKEVAEDIVSLRAVIDSILQGKEYDIASIAIRDEPNQPVESVYEGPVYESENDFNHVLPTVTNEDMEITSRKNSNEESANDPKQPVTSTNVPEEGDCLIQ